MTKKHFISLADAIRATYPSSYNELALRQWELMRDELVNWCAEQNPNFNRQRWLDYIAGKCGPCSGEVKVKS